MFPLLENVCQSVEPYTRFGKTFAEIKTWKSYVDIFYRFIPRAGILPPYLYNEQAGNV